MPTPITIAAIILYLVAMTFITWLWFRGDKEISKDELEELEQLRSENTKLKKTLAYQTRVLTTERNNLYDWGKRACEVIDKGSVMMTLEQISRWEGCRGVLESFEEEEWRFPTKKKETPKASC